MADQPIIPFGLIQAPEDVVGVHVLDGRMNTLAGLANLMDDRTEQVDASVPHIKIDLNLFNIFGEGQEVLLEGFPHLVRVFAQYIDGRHYRVLAWYDRQHQYGPYENQGGIAVMRLEPNLVNPIGQEGCYVATDALTYGGGPATSVWGNDLLLYAHLVTTAAGQRMTNWFADHDVAGAGQAWFADSCMAFDAEANDIEADLVVFEGQPQLAANLNMYKQGLRQFRRRVAVYRGRVDKFRMLLATGIHVGNPPQQIPPPIV